MKNSDQCKVIIPHGKTNVNKEIERKFETIFSMDNEKALEILSKVKQIQPIPGTFFVTLEDTARYFEVDYNYLQFFLRDKGFTSSHIPEDAFVWGKGTLEAHLKENGYQCTSCSRDTFTICNGNPENCKGVEMIKKASVKLLSTRALLGIAIRLSTAYGNHKGISAKVINAMEEAGIFEAKVRTRATGVTEKPTATESQEMVAVEKNVVEVSEAATTLHNAKEEELHAEHNRRQTIEMTAEMFQFVVRSIAKEAVHAAILEFKAENR